MLLLSGKFNERFHNGTCFHTFREHALQPELSPQASVCICIYSHIMSYITIICKYFSLFTPLTLPMFLLLTLKFMSSNLIIIIGVCVSVCACVCV